MHRKIYHFRIEQSFDHRDGPKGIIARTVGQVDKVA